MTTSPTCAPPTPPTRPPALQVYNLNQAKKDIDAVFGLGIFEDVSIKPTTAPGSTMEDPRVRPYTWAIP